MDVNETIQQSDNKDGLGEFCILCRRLHHLQTMHKIINQESLKIKGKVHPCTGTEALYRPYGP